MFLMAHTEGCRRVGSSMVLDLKLSCELIKPRLAVVAYAVGSWLFTVSARPAVLVTAAGRAEEDTWLILPVVICLSQRLSHACLSTGFGTAKPRMAH